MYIVYPTEGIILKSVPIGEADCYYSILTRDLGLVFAEAKGVRKMESKLRYSLLTFGAADFSLIRGKGRWRIASAELKRHYFAELKGEEPAKMMLARAASLVTRLVQGEERNEQLYDNFKNGASFLADQKPRGQFLRNTEYLLALRVLFSLGYLGSMPGWNSFTTTPQFDERMLVEVGSVEREVLSVINQSLRESQL
jgi:DNA repair protein RecO (recombination protein O)